MLDVTDRNLSTASLVSLAEERVTTLDDFKNNNENDNNSSYSYWTDQFHMNKPTIKSVENTRPDLPQFEASAAVRTSTKINFDSAYAYEEHRRRDTFNLENGNNGGVESDVYAFDSSMTSFESSSRSISNQNSVSDRQRRDALLHLLNEKDAYDTTHSRRSSV